KARKGLQADPLTVPQLRSHRLVTYGHCVRSDFVAHRQPMKKASLAAAFAASLCLNPLSFCLAAEDAPAGEARVAEEQLLGAADEEARFLSLQPFTRELAASVVIKTSLD